MIRNTLSASLCVAGFAGAQDITATLVTTATWSASGGGQAQVVPQAPGVLSANGFSLAQVNTPSVQIEARGWWNNDSNPTVASFAVGTSAYSLGDPTGQASYGMEILLSLTALTTTDVYVRFEPTALQVTGGQLAPIVRIDVGDDGTDELTESAPYGGSLARTIGPTGLPVRCRFLGSLVGDGQINTQVAVQILPRNGLGSAVSSFGCDGLSVYCLPRFDGDVMLGSGIQSGLVSILVLGLGVQPIQVGDLGLWPCILWSSPDVLMPVQSYALTTLSIPPAAHPFHFWAQMAALQPTGKFTVTDSLLVIGT